MPELQQFSSTLESIPFKQRIKYANNLEKLRLFKNVEKIRLVKNVTFEKQKSLLKDLEVADGNIYNASKKQMKDFIEIINTMDDVNKSTTSWLDQQVIVNGLNKEVADRFKAMKKVKWAMPITSVLESVGLKKLAQRLYNHTSTELGYIGKFSEFEYKQELIFGKKWNKTKDMMYLFDKERYIERKKLGILKTTEKNFIKDAFDIETWKPKDTKAGRLVKDHIELMKFYKDALVGKDGALRQVLNDAEFEKFIADKNINWINETNNVYVQRRVTKEFKKYYDPQGLHFKKIVDKQTDFISKKFAKNELKKEGVKNPSREQVREKAELFKVGAEVFESSK